MTEVANVNRGFGQAGAVRASSHRRGIRAGESVEIHIEELVLHGFRPGNLHRIGDALQQELAHLLEACAFSPHVQKGFALDHVDAGTVRMNAGENAEVIGGKIARALYRELSLLGKA